jgi:hypothetical protein
LEQGDADAAKANQVLLFKQYRTMERALRRILNIMVQAALEEYERAQERDAARFAEAVDTGDKERAAELLDEHRELHRTYHDMYVNWFAEIASALHETYGTDRFYEIMLETGDEFREDFAAWARLTPEQLLDSSVFLQMCHPETELEVEEDDEKYTIRQHCGTGGRLLREGRFDGEKALARIPVANPASVGKPGMPTYCAHTVVWNSVLSYKNEGRPLWVIDHPNDSSCTIHIYKDPAKIPREYLERIRDARSAPTPSPDRGVAPS